MKLLRQLTVLVMLLCIPVALLAAEADADFENESNFDAYCAGNGKIHVKVLIFSERGYDHNAGRGNNQSLGNEPDATPHATGSRVHTKLVSNNASAIHLHYWADNYYNNTGSAGSHKWPKDKGVVWVQLWSGVIECTNTYDGIKRTVIADGTVQQIELKRKDEGNHLTWFEFDWYPPEDLDAQDFRLYITTDHHKWNQSSFKTKTYDFDLFTGADSDQAPILSDPFFYPINQNGEAAAFGKLAYSYVCMQDVYMYRTSLSPTTYALTEKSGLMYVDAQDTVQHGFRACFYLLRSTDNTTKHWMWSNRVEPATAGARFVVSDSGDILSPKYAPDTTAPADIAAGNPKAVPIPMIATPMEPAVDHDEPVASDTMEHSRHAVNRNTLGAITLMP